ncbi:MAG: SpoIID/LytB domain-containing protein [Elusimicrobia bacterium]|nr:SpoIID/LytB domain-containing protein [Elusimicrobiota bacterium]
MRGVLLAVGVCAGLARAQTPDEAPAAAPAAAVSPAPADVISPAPPDPAAPARVDPRAAKARSLYFTGDTLKAAEAFEAAVKVGKSTDASADWRVWADGAIAWAEAGRPDKAVAWHRRAAALNGGAAARAALGWALLRGDQPLAADAEFARALASDPDSSPALLGAGRAKLALGKPREAIDLLSRASPAQSLADYYLGMAYEKVGDDATALEAYKRAVGADSYFHEGRATLSRSYLRQRRYNEAWRHLQKLVEADPGSKLARAMLNKVRPLLTRPRDAQAPALSGTPPPEAPVHETEPWDGKVPVVRIGVSSTQMGKPRPRRSATVRGNGAWKAVDPKTGRALLTSEAGEAWTLRLIPAKAAKKKKGRSRLEFHAADGRVAAVPGDAALLRPLEPATSTLTLEDDPEHAPRAFRGDLELALFGGRRTIRVVNIIGLEDYTHGVVSAEMPQRAPFEALKAQAVVARTHALFIKTVTKRHRKEGYDLCDEQHCQVYGGRRAETERTRAVVVDTRGRVAVYQGKPAHVIYSSHCGGRTQSGTDIGWGNVPYWKSVDDSAEFQDPPATPLDLRLLLSDWPKGFDRPSGYVHPAHARWTRAIPAKVLEDKLHRKFKIGKLRGLRVLRRVPSGHVESLLIVGSKRSRKLSDEMDIRSLLGVGSLRSTMFVLDTEYRKEGKLLVPETFVFRGGGWGHAVGLCQSGAMGRAEAGQTYETIVMSYFPGVEIGRLDY